MPGTQCGQAIQYMLSTVISQNTGSQRIKITKVTPCVYLMLRELTWEFPGTPETSPSPQNQRAPGAPWRATPSTAQLSSREKCKKHTGGARLAGMSLQRLHVCNSMAHVVQSSRETGKKAGILPASLKSLRWIHYTFMPTHQESWSQEGGEWGQPLGAGRHSWGQRVTAAEEPKGLNRGSCLCSLA